MRRAHNVSLEGRTVSVAQEGQEVLVKKEGQCQLYMKGNVSPVGRAVSLA